MRLGQGVGKVCSIFWLDRFVFHARRQDLASEGRMSAVIRISEGESPLSKQKIFNLLGTGDGEGVPQYIRDVILL